MTVMIGVPMLAAEKRMAEAERSAKKKPTKADLVKQAEDLGIEVPESATIAQIKALIEEAEGVQ